MFDMQNLLIILIMLIIFIMLFDDSLSYHANTCTLLHAVKEEYVQSQSQSQLPLPSCKKI